MSDANPFSCFIMGTESLLIQCGEILLREGHDIRGVVSRDRAIERWARDRQLELVDPRDDLAARLGERWLHFKLNRRKTLHRRGRSMPTTKTAVHLVGCQRSGTDMSIYLLDRNLDVRIMTGTPQIEEHSEADTDANWYETAPGSWLEQTACRW